MKRTIITVAIIILVIVIALALPNVTPGVGTYTEEKPAAMLSGIWHGWIAPVTLFIGIFNSNVNIYEVVNTGWWYNFGFYIAVISGFGGLALFRKPKVVVVEDA